MQRPSGDCQAFPEGASPPSGYTACTPQLVIFDKGGTLIDFHGVWCPWARELGRRLEHATGLPLGERLYEAIGFHDVSGRIDPEGMLARGSMTDLRGLVLDLLLVSGLDRACAEQTLTQVWFAPDPLVDLRPLADIPALFRALRARGMKIAVATMDDRVPTEATFRELGVDDMVDVLVCVDDGLPPKPAPDMVWAICRSVGIDPAHTLVVGDAVTDLEMGRAAGVCMVIGVSTGVASPAELRPHADRVLSSVAALI